MRFGAYAVTPQCLRSLWLIFRSSCRVRLTGIPPLAGDNPREIAKEALRANARGVLWAGAGHFRYMWVSDFAKALRGAEQALSAEYLGGLIGYMIRESYRQGRVTSCFTPKRGFDMPYHRGDGLPWLVYAVWEYCRWTGSRRLFDENRPALQSLLADYERDYFKDGLVSPAVTGDWMDTIMRPSSTYNNVCALKMLFLARELGLRTATSPEAFEAKLLESRWRGDHFTDYAGTEDFSADAPVYALYFDLFDKKIREAMIAGLERSGLTEPYPIISAPKTYDTGLMPFVTRLTPEYHSTIWLHLGYMYLNGLKKCGRDVSALQAKMEGLIMKYRNMVETLSPDGRLYGGLFHSTEYGLSMAAGQYLELAGSGVPA